MITKDLDIYSIPLYYISFNENKNIEDQYKKNGFHNINHFSAINGKKIDMKNILDKNLITIRTYEDLIDGRRQHSGFPSKGGIGCSLSHYTLWNLCIDKNLPFIIITEEDNTIKPINNHIDTIRSILNKPKTLFINTKISKEEHRIHFFMTHFYIVSQEVCKELIKDFFPIDVQVDIYLAHLATIKRINVEGFIISKQKQHLSAIQTICPACIMPKKTIYYILFFAIIIIIVFLLYIIRSKYKKCNNNCTF